jgi:hypothetical protein
LLRCLGTPFTGGTCNDNFSCTSDDTCVFDDYGRVECRGTPRTEGPCDDYEPCTVGDTCVLAESGDYSVCQPGTPTPGVPCDDGFDQTINDMCVTVRFNTFCRGDLIEGAAEVPRRVG